jgi:hypothetical protein
VLGLQAPGAVTSAPLPSPSPVPPPGGQETRGGPRPLPSLPRR